MPALTITHADLVLPGSIREQANLTIRDGRIAEIGGAPPKDAEIISADGRLVLPGLFDVHAHGRMVALDPAAVEKNLALDCMDFARAGVTRFLPTLASAPIEAWLSALPFIGRAVADPPAGAVPMGVHLEGIFLNAEAGGAHPGPLIQPFDAGRAEHKDLFEKHPGLVRMVTFAPEVPGSEALIEICGRRGIVMSLGHSAAGSEAVRGFVDRGVAHMTHLFNGMKGLHHREPGPVLAGLLDDRVSVDFICDGFHIHPDVVRLIHRMKAPPKRLLITDSVVIQLPGAEPGAADQPNRLPGGAFAGSRLRLGRAVRNYVEFTSCPLWEAVAMASLFPAALLGLDQELGSIETGKTADLWIADRGLEPKAVFIAGERVV